MKLKRTVLCIVLSVCMLFACIPAVSAEGEAPKDYWKDYVATSFEGGTGTKADPYQIASPEQLALLASEVNSGVVGKTHSKEYFILTNDIDLSGRIWTPLGYESYGSGSSQSFSGHFDGKGHKVTGLYVDERGKNRSAGLFGCVTAFDNEVLIKNLTVEKGTVYAGDDTDDASVQYGAGLLIGHITILGGSGITGAYIENCSVSGTVSSNMYAGGLAGSTNYTHFSNCYANANVEGWCVTGGFVGYAFMSEFKDCSATGDVDSKGWCTGGFSGFLYDSDAVRCAAYGKVSADDWRLGGFVGYAIDSTNISNSIAAGDVISRVTGWLPRIGGFAGEIADGVSIEKCHAAGEVKSALADKTTIGGILGCDSNENTVNGCSFNGEKNNTVDATGTNASGTYEISKVSELDVLINICEDYYGSHNFADIPQVDPSCTEGGYKAGKKCTRCGYKEGFEALDPLGHDYENGICTRCSQVEETLEIEIPFTVTVKQGGNLAPGKQEFEFEICETGVIDQDAYSGVTYTAKAETDGNGDYTAKIVINGPASQVINFICEGFFFKQKDTQVPFWTYSDKIWYVMPLYGEGSNIEYVIYPAMSVKDGDEEYYVFMEEENPPEIMTFENIYTDSYKNTGIPVYPDDSKTKDDTAGSENTPATSGDSTSPKTFDGNNLFMWIAVLFVSGGVLTAATLCENKKQTEKSKK